MIGDGKVFFLAELIKEHENIDAINVGSLLKLIERLADFGRVHDTQKVRSLRDGLFEIKTKRGLRVTFFWSGNRSIICGHCFVKDSQKTPLREIDLALRWKKAYEDAVKTNTLRII